MWNGANRNNSGRIDTSVCMQPIVVSLDVIKIIKVGGGLESVVLPIQPTQPEMDVRIAITNSSNVALEELYNGHEESDISLGQTVTDEVNFVLQQSLSTVECFKELFDGFAIRLGGLRETTPIYAICNEQSKKTPLNSKN
jgi:hypothetical protein